MYHLFITATTAVTSTVYLSQKSFVNLVKLELCMRSFDPTFQANFPIKQTQPLPSKSGDVGVAVFVL